MTAATVLDRLHRVKPTKPGQWMAGCPCCASRKGRPLAVTFARGFELIFGERLK
jgi:hypothetical protein